MIIRPIEIIRHQVLIIPQVQLQDQRIVRTETVQQWVEAAMTWKQLVPQHAQQTTQQLRWAMMIAQVQEQVPQGMVILPAVLLINQPGSR